MSVVSERSNADNRYVGALRAAALVLSVCSAAVPAAAQEKAGQVDVGNVREVRSGLYVIEDKDYVPAVPNIGIVTGTRAVLVVDTGIDQQNGDAVLAVAQRIARGRMIYVSATHFHPEHGFGLVAFKGKATIVYNDAQRAEFLEKRSNYVKLFTQLGMGKLVGTTAFVMPDKTYAGHLRLDLGGRVVEFYSGHAGHTRGDQIIYVPSLRTMFLGDLLETASFPIMPWYPEIHDTDVSPAKWLATLQWAAALDPVIVVPGHGPIGSRSDIIALGRYIAGVRDAVRASCANTESVADLQSKLVPKLKSEHPNWHLSEWVGPSLNAFVKDYCPYSA